MGKTIHVYHSHKGWVVKSPRKRVSLLFPTQREAIQSARAIARQSAPSQVAVYGSDGRVRDHITYGLPRVQDPLRRSPAAIRIERAAARLALRRFAADPLPPRG